MKDYINSFLLKRKNMCIYTTFDTYSVSNQNRIAAELFQSFISYSVTKCGA